MAPGCRRSTAPRLRALLALLLPVTLGSSFFGGAFPGGAPFGASAGPRADNEGYYRDLGLSREPSHSLEVLLQIGEGALFLSRLDSRRSELIVGVLIYSISLGQPHHPRQLPVELESP